MEASDEELASRARLGDERAFEELVARWHAPLFRLGHRLTGDADAAADVRQTTWIRAWSGLRAFEGRARFSTWLFTIALRCARDRERGRTAGERALDGHLARGNGRAADPPPDREAERREESERVGRAVGALPPLEREALVLRHFFELPFPAIAEIVGSPETTVKTRCAKGLERLRARLSRSDGGELR